MNSEIIEMPTKGQVIELSQVNDPTFSQELMGKGFAIISEDGNYYAPFNGVVSMIFPTKHAIGLTSDNGVELLIHIGLETVELNGQYFESFVETGQKIKEGDMLIKVDIEKLKELGYDITTPVIVTNTDHYQKIELENIDNTFKLCVE